MKHDLHSNNSGAVTQNYAINKDGTINLDFVTGFTNPTSQNFHSTRQEAVVENEPPKETLNYYYGDRNEKVYLIELIFLRDFYIFKN